MHTFLHAPYWGFLKPPEHWNLVFLVKVNIFQGVFFIPNSQHSNFPSEYRFISGFCLFSLLLPIHPPTHTHTTPCSCPPSWLSELCSLCSFTISNALHIWLDKLYLRLEMFQWHLLFVLLLLLLSLQIIFFCSVQLVWYSNGTFPKS